MQAPCLLIALIVATPVFAEENAGGTRGYISGTVNEMLGNNERDKRLDHIEKRLDNLEKKVDKLDEGQKQIEKEFDRLDKKYGGGY